MKQVFKQLFGVLLQKLTSGSKLLGMCLWERFGAAVGPLGDDLKPSSAQKCAVIVFLLSCSQGLFGI